MSEQPKISANTCYIHCGTEKTGSTSLQRFLALNAEALKRQFVWVPRSLVYRPESSPYNHLFISTASRLSKPKPDDLQSMIGCSSRDEVLAHRKAVQLELQAEYQSLGFIPRTIIISNEHIHSRLRTLEDLENVRQLLAPYCDNFVPIVYLRDQLSLTGSLAMTSIRNGKTELRLVPDFSTPNGFDPVLGVDFTYYDYAELLQRLDQAFPGKGVLVRLYHEAVASGRSVVDDFFSLLPANIDGMSRPRRENAGFNRKGALFLAAFNRALKERPASVEIRQRITNFIEQNYSGGLPALTTPETRVFQGQFAEGNESVRTLYFPDRVSLFPKLPADEEDDLYPTLTMEEAFVIFADILSVTK